MAKRISIKERRKQEGRGTKIFTEGLTIPRELIEHSNEKKRKPVLIQLPEEIIKQRDKLYLSRLVHDEDIEKPYEERRDKSHLLEEAVRWYFEILEKEGDPYLKS